MSQYAACSQELKPILFGSGLANCVREALLSEKRGNVAILIDWAIRNHCTDIWLSVDDIMALAPFSTYRLTLALQDELIAKKAIFTGKAGRPKQVYSIPGKDETRRLVTPGNLTKSDHLPDWAFASLTDYRAAMYLSLILRSASYVATNFVSYSRQFLMTFLSVSKKTLRNYERQYAIYVQSVLTETVIESHNLFYLPTAKRFGSYLNVITDTVTDRVPAIISLAYRAFKIGAKIIHVEQAPNRYSVLSWDVFHNGRPAQVAYYPPAV
jgi:hypothetical protein